MALQIKEQDILSGIIEYLLRRKIKHAHVRNTGSIIRRNGQTIFARPKFHQKGVPDILACYKGKPIAIEVKSASGRLSDEQIEWLKGWEDAGGCFIVSRSVEEVVRFIQSLEEIKQ